MFSWEMGIAFGQALERLRHVETATERLATDVRDIKRELSAAKAWAARIALLVLLWTSAGGVAWNADDLGASIATLIRFVASNVR